ncbi:hypothetical protein R2F61_01090 [Mollicutes bacterium LVI A0078]|nr:hypothetical protein RZE84_01090 [Mollicutes bacterium LVI A0075]WOO91173.1 hypothetical protein R2F61_01090 [Mollicutes bacterium LVI A0078]
MRKLSDLINIEHSIWSDENKEEIVSVISQSIDKNELLIAEIALKISEMALSSNDSDFPSWIDKDSYDKLYDETRNINKETALEYISEVQYYGRNFDCNFTEDIYLVNMEIPWQLTDCGTHIQLLFKGDNIIFATYHHDLLAKSIDAIEGFEKNNLLSSNFKKSY